MFGETPFLFTTDPSADTETFSELLSQQANDVMAATADAVKTGGTVDIDLTGGDDNSPSAFAMPEIPSLDEILPAGVEIPTTDGIDAEIAQMASNAKAAAMEAMGVDPNSMMGMGMDLLEVPSITSFIDPTTRCINVPDFGFRLGDLLLGLDFDLWDLPCGLSEKIEELLNLKELESMVSDFAKDAQGELVTFDVGVDPMEARYNQLAVAAFTGSDDIKVMEDDSTQTAITGGLIRQSTRMGLSGNIPILFAECPKSVDRTYLNSYLLGSMRRSLDQGSLDTINECTTITGGAALLTVYPDAVVSVLSGYTIPLYITELDYPDEANKLLDCLDRIDPNWDRYQSLPIFDEHGAIVSYRCDVASVAPFLRIGKGARELLEGHDRTLVTLAVADKSKQMAIQSAVKLYYPLAAVA